MESGDINNHDLAAAKANAFQAHLQARPRNTKAAFDSRYRAFEVSTLYAVQTLTP
jgi:hypothetical protein